jgi:hypothetical protein
MRRRITITILACLAVLWSAAASAQDKINPNQVPPNKVTPPPLIPNLIKPPPLPADPTGGVVGERERQALEALRDAEAAGKLEKELGLDAAMGAGPGDDRPPTPGFDKDDETVMQMFCKTRVSRLFPGLCPGRYGGGFPPDGDLSDFYNTKSSTKPGAGTPFDVPTAGSGVPSRGGQASDDDATNDPEPGKPDRSWTDSGGQNHNAWAGVSHNENGEAVLEVYEEVRSSDGSATDKSATRISPDHSPGAQTGDVFVRTYTLHSNGQTSAEFQHCGSNGCIHDIAIQPDERGPQGKARAWFCARTPEAAGCKPLKSGFEIDPAHPDGEGTPTGSRAETPRLGREAVSDPGPADSEIRGTTGGGGSGPLDMKDPITPDRPK